MLKLLAWLKDGPYRARVLALLNQKPHLSSELAVAFNVNRASMSRILRALREAGLVSATNGSSRTVIYSITDKGKKLMVKLGG